jgi:hypothetical protein
MSKGHDPRFSKEIYNITFIKDNQFLINSETHKKVFNRWELFKVPEGTLN